MAAESLVDSKFEASKQLASALVQRGAPLLAAFWDFHEDVGRWTLVLVPTSPEEQRRLIKQATDLLIDPPYRSIFSISDPLVDSHQIDRARALGAYIRYEPYIGRRFDTTFTNGEFFESVVPVYFKPELLTRLAVAS
ncbi:hypothetical protein [Bradyrhizobium sp.]|jgi:hypothetical protein|uniref:hypothetical protein n=1 Tax=Bradyrhizobium sp. TaxID=376 RepID=UPI002E017AE6|nr:hypothetical protein [Bradyrhizobium sp.]